jgi:hypothetical protein
MKLDIQPMEVRAEANRPGMAICSSKLAFTTLIGVRRNSSDAGFEYNRARYGLTLCHANLVRA